MTGFFLICVMFVLYFIPSIVASGKDNGGGAIVVNIFLGWTLVGWVAALAWAVSLKDSK